MKTSDEIRSKITELFEQFQPQLQGYHNYARQVVALSEEFHKSALTETFGGIVEELTLVCTLNSAETPKSLDQTLAKLTEQKVKLKKIIYDRVSRNYYLYS